MKSSILTKKNRVSKAQRTSHTHNHVPLSLRIEKGGALTKKRTELQRLNIWFKECP